MDVISKSYVESSKVGKVMWTFMKQTTEKIGTVIATENVLAKDT